MENEEYLAQHKFSIWQGKNGFWYSYLPDELKKRKLIKRKTEEEVKEIVASYYARKGRITVEKIFNEWNLRRLELGQISPATHMRNTYTYNKHLKKYADVDVRDIEGYQITEFLEESVLTEHLRRKAFLNLKGVIKGMAKYCKRRKYIDFNITDVFEDVELGRKDFNAERQKKDGLEAFNDDELKIFVDYLMNHLADPKNLAILLIMVSGLRIGEVCTLQYEDFDSPCVFHIRRTQTRYRKDGQIVYDVKNSPKTKAGERTVVIPDEYAFIFKRCQVAKTSKWCFADNDGSFFKDYIIRGKFYKVCEACGLEKRSPHDGRRTYASMLLNSKADEMFIIDQMGHTDIKTTKEYYYRDIRNVDEKKDIVNHLKLITG